MTARRLLVDVEIDALVIDPMLHGCVLAVEDHSEDLATRVARRLPCQK